MTHSENIYIYTDTILVFLQAASSDVPDAGGYYYNYCTGYRPTNDNTAGNAALKLGSTVSWRAFWGQWLGPSNGGQVAGSNVNPTSNVGTYTVLDGSSALTYSAIIALAVTSFTF